MPHRVSEGLRDTYVKTWNSGLAIQKWMKFQWNMFKNNSVHSWHENKPKSVTEVSDRSLPPRKVVWRFGKFYLSICSPSVNSAHVSFPWIPHRCSVWPIVRLESRWQWKKLKWSLSIQKCQRLVISQRLRFLIIKRYSTWQQKCLLLKLLPSIVMVLCYALTYGYYGTKCWRCCTKHHQPQQPVRC